MDKSPYNMTKEELAAEISATLDEITRLEALYAEGESTWQKVDANREHLEAHVRIYFQRLGA